MFDISFNAGLPSRLVTRLIPAKAAQIICYATRLRSNVLALNPDVEACFFICPVR